MATRKDLKPGDLVVEFSQRNAQGTRAHFALVIGVDYPRNDHMGCEERIKVMWADPVRFETICDSEIVAVDTHLLTPEKK